MQKLYHTLLVVGILLVVLFLFLRPLLPYLPKAVMLARMYMNARVSDLRSENGPPSGPLRSEASEASRTNFLILGLGGPKNEPSGLTDTIIFASVDHTGDLPAGRQAEVLLLSIPRDIWVPEMRAKINSAYYYGNRGEGLGLEWARRYTSQIIGQPVHYVVVISFEGFEDLVDVLGGVDIIVDRGFTDTQYPMPGRETDPCGGDPELRCRYETVTFATGSAHFDGKTALKFVRSRQAVGEEGSDFARSNRQQKVIVALKEKVLVLSFYLNSEKIGKVLGIVMRSVETDIPESHFAALGRLALVAQKANIRQEVVGFEAAESGFLKNPAISPAYDNQWVLLPRGGGWVPVQTWVSCLLKGDSCPAEEFIQAIKD